VSAVAAATPDVSSPEAYAARLYERHRRAIYGLCLKQLRSREDADDAVQTTFIYALQSLRRGVVPQMELPWLLTIARNACSTRRRSGSRRGAYETPHDLESMQDRLATPERADVATGEDFLHALRAIPESQRTALLLREWRGLSYEEIGSELGLSQAATEALLFRARQNVAQRLGHVGLKPLHGLPILSFLRNLFQTAAAKTVAVGAGAVLTIAAIPAAEPQRSDVSAPPAAVQMHGGATGTHAPLVIPSQRARAAEGRRDVSQNMSRDRAGSHGSGTETTLPSPPVTTPNVGRTPTSPTPAPAASSPLPSSGDPVMTAVDTVDNVVETASDVTAGPNLPTPPLPAVTLPTLPVQPPQLPSVSLP
jgi:RNA polymerase sigma-70 factor (ECF subfamily)